MNDKPQILDVLIIGGGPIGMACGIEASKHGLDYLIVEKGCLVNSIYHFPVNMTFFSTSEKIEMGNQPFISHGPRPTRREALEYYRRLKEYWNLRILTYEKAEAISCDENIYQIRTSRAVYAARSVVIATGFYDHPQPMGVPGEDLPKVKHYFDDPHPYSGQRVIVVGAANSAVDAALETWRKGAQVTMVIRGTEIGSRVKYWIKPDIENRIKEGAIKALYKSQIREIRAFEVDVETPEGLLTLPNDWVLAMTGFRPDYKWLAETGLQFTDDAWRMPVRNEQTFESNLTNVFLAGTVCGGLYTNKWFIENSIEHAETVMKEIAKRLR